MVAKFERRSLFRWWVAVTWTDELVVRVYTYTQSRTVNPLVVTIRPSISLPRHQLRPPAFYRRQRPFCRAWHRDIGSVAPRSSFTPLRFLRSLRRKSLWQRQRLRRHYWPPFCNLEFDVRLRWVTSRCYRSAGRADTLHLQGSDI